MGFRNTEQLRKLNTKIADEINANADNSIFKVCHASILTNCAEYISNEICGKCQSGYYVDFYGRCSPNPLPAIPNCRRYSSASNCIDCSQGYYLESSNKCTAVTPIINCLLYNTDTSFSSCKKCIDEYYLSAENICKPRTQLSRIDFCVALSDHGERCERCLDGYNKTSDKLKCLPIVENCEVYVHSTINSLRLECSACREGFYFNEVYNFCSRGNVENCQRYERSSNRCTLCNPNFYLVSNTCLPHIQLPSCVDYSPTTANSCSVCRPFTSLFTNMNRCVDVDRILNCKSYASKTTCGVCDDGYYLYNPSTCRVIPLEYNCLQMDANMDCTKCLLNYVLDSGKCYEPQEYITRNCEKSNLNGIISSAELKCDYCRPNHVPINYKESFVCQDKSYIKRTYLPPQQQFDDNCLQFTENSNGDLECVRCHDSFVIEGVTCVKSCTNSERMTVYKQYIEVYDKSGDILNDSIRVIKTNVCQKTISNCAVAVPNINTDFVHPTYSCVECMPGYFKAITIGGSSAILTRPDERIELVGNKYGTSPLTLAPRVQCLKTNGTIKIIGESHEQDFVDSCDYFQMIYPNLYGCNKCKWGTTGVVMDLIKNCNTFSNPQTCTKCEAGYYLKSAKECMPVQNILNCTAYDAEANSTVCTQCSDKYYVDANECKERENSLNVSFSTLKLDEDSVECDSGYILDEDTDPYTCQKLPHNCVDATIAGSVVTCTECKRDASYLSGGDCLDGTVTGCAEYKVAANECNECVNGRYKVSDTECASHATANDDLCKTWSQDTKNLCETCEFNSVKLEIQTKCLPVYLEIDNCDEYSNIYQCKTCAAGYYLDNLGRTCREIPADLHCDTYLPIDLNNDDVFDEDDLTTNNRFAYTCTKCKEGFYMKTATESIDLLSGGNQNEDIATCYNHLEFARAHCEETDVDGTVDFGEKYCTGCAENYFPYDFNNKYVCVERAYVNLKTPAFDSNCEVISYDGANEFKCLRCKFGYFVDVDNAGDYVNTCVTECNNPDAPPNDFNVPYLFHYTLDDNDITFETGVCKDSTDVSATPGAIYQTGIKLDDETLSTVISKCKGTHIPLLTYTATDYHLTFFNPNGSSYKMTSPFDGYEAVNSCEEHTGNATIRGFTNQSKFIENCEFYHQLDTDLYGCMKCKFGYRGRIKGYTDGTPDNYGFIEYCDAFDDCDTTVNSGMYNTIAAATETGLMSRYFSCLKCKDDGGTARVLIAAIAAGNTPAAPGNDFAAIYGLREYKLGTDTNDEEYTANVENLEQSLSNFCTDSTAATMATDLDLESQNLIVANCAAYYLNVDSRGTDADAGLICAACLPGYTPTYDGTQEFKVTTCTAIANCATPADEKVLNKCLGCVQGYNIFTDVVDYGTCVDVSGGDVDATSCFAATDADNCAICRPGYELDTTVAGKATCYQLTVPQCSQVNFYDDFSSNYALSNTVINTALYLYTGNSSTNVIAGCTACTNDDDVLLLNKVDSNNEVDPKVCVSGTDNRQTDSVDNCTRVGWNYDDSEYICRECDATFILTEDYKCTAEDATRLPNCKIAKEMDGDVCVECTNDTFVIVGGVCLDTTDDPLPTGLVENCKTYTAGTKDLPMGECETCIDDYYLDNNECKAIADANCAEYSAADGCLACKNNHALFKLSGKNICIDLDVVNDSEWDYDNNCKDIVVDDAGSDDIQSKHLVCKACKEHTVLSDDVSDLSMRSKCTNIVTTADAECTAYDIKAALADSTFDCTECDDYSTHYLNPFDKSCTARTSIDNCASYDENSDTCTACEDNYLLNFTQTQCESLTSNIGLRARNKGYIQTCRHMPACETEKFFEGLSADLTSFYSCHACKKDDEIPFIAVRTDSDEDRIESLNEYGFNADNADPLNKGTQGPAIQCLKPEHTNFNVALEANFVFPDNCALGLMKTNFAPNALHSSSTSADLDKATIMCTACKPGYKAESATITGGTTPIRYMAASCTEINNCEFSRWFNACTKCKANYSHSYSLTDGIKYDECVSYSENPQCYAVHIDGSVKTCKVCNKGTYLNKDGICDLINPPRCEFGHFKFNQHYEAKDLTNGLFTINNGVGCNKCVEGFAGMYVKTDEFICSESLYLVNTNLTSSTFYIENCLHYTNNLLGELLCAVCSSGFVRTVDGKCVAGNSVANCRVAKDSSTCSECEPDYVLVDRKCLNPTIDKCVEYYNNTDGYEQVCRKCEAEYYLSANKCVAGSVKNCKHLETATKCNECAEGYSLILGDHEKSFCYPNSSILNCKNFNLTKFQAGVLECTECINNNFVISTSKSDFDPTYCMPFTDLETCVEFNNGSVFSQSSFECQKCAPDFYLSNGTCNRRTVRPLQCREFSITSDRCTECAEGYYVDSNGTSCSAYPDGIQGCREYKFRSRCTGCESNMYLEDNKCVPVPTEIPNCLYYDDAEVCNTCSPGYVNIKGRCVTPYAQNCLTYASLTECKTCPSDHGLKKEETLLNCVPKNISNCVKSEDVEPFNCLVCETDYYPLEGACTSVTTTIDNCVEYDSATTCAKCGNRTALSIDKQSCDNSPDVVVQVDPNCSNPKIVETPVCNTCKPGHYFKYGLCKACKTQTLEKGCYNCDPEDPKKCLICSSGYYMSAEGDCVDISQLELSEERIQKQVKHAKIVADGHVLHK